MVGLHALLLGSGLAALVAGELNLGPTYLPGVGAVVVSTVFTWILAVRTGGRWLLFSAMAGALGAATLVLDRAELRAGAAVLTLALGAVTGVMTTVPAVKYVHAIREVILAGAIAAVGGLAAAGFEPVVTLTRFEYAALGVALALSLAVVFRLGAGLHGLGTRGLVVMLGGGVSLGFALIYAELLRRYGTPSLIESALDAVRWARSHLGAFPRTMPSLLGIPALAWGCHQRARRRQGWWASAFGVCAMVPGAVLLVNPSVNATEAALTAAYTLVVGLVFGFLVVRLDLALTGSHGKGGRRAEEATAIRPEPQRTQALL